MASKTNLVVLVTEKNARFAYYNLDEYRLGQGAMGEVFKGWNVEKQSDWVAIKRVYPRHAQHPQIRERAKYEASLSIDHPNLIKMLGYSETRDGSIYIISDYVQGNTIDKFVISISPDTKTDIVTRMMCLTLDALTCLHQQRVWHRDIKPSNIMVENGCNVRVMDLGIATSEGISHGTLIGRGFGTYPYAPPEQITGQRNEINATSDLYSLGITFYELLTGVNPFAGGSDVDILDRQVKMPLPYNPVIPKQLFAILQKATAKNQSNRYQSATEFKEALLHLNHKPDSNILWKLITISSIIVTLLLFLFLLISK